ncbi:hypothetical protein ABBQ38_000729 [Trebouxia sp. C0009 RCD-2024]
MGSRMQQAPASKARVACLILHPCFFQPSNSQDIYRGQQRNLGSWRYSTKSSVAMQLHPLRKCSLTQAKAQYSDTHLQLTLQAPNGNLEKRDVTKIPMTNSDCDVERLM